jgi:hypothetical protein
MPRSVSHAGVTVDSGGTLSGTGTVVGSLTNSGTVSPGNSPGIITVASFTQAADPDGDGNPARLLIEIGGRKGAGVNPGGHDQRPLFPIAMSPS